MSIQENYLKAIADAIREKDGTEAPIPAKTFAERIRALNGGGGGGTGTPFDTIQWSDAFVRYVGHVKLLNMSISTHTISFETLGGLS